MEADGCAGDSYGSDVGTLIDTAAEVWWDVGGDRKGREEEEREEGGGLGQTHGWDISFRKIENEMGEKWEF